LVFCWGVLLFAFFNEEWSAVFLEESNEPPHQSDETFGRRLGPVNMAYKLSVLKQINLLSIFILLLTCLSLQQQIELKQRATQTDERPLCKLNHIYRIKSWILVCS